MAFEVEIFNYKTIKHAVFTIDRYTLLVGTNFIGKSASVQAIVAALKNADGDGFIRRGEKFCEVRLTNNSNKVIWHKEKGNNFYVIEYEGKLFEYKKMGRGEIPPQIQAMGFGPLIVATEKAYLWYARQFETLFLVDKPKQNFTTDLIASVTNLDSLYKASDIGKKKLTGIKSDLKTRTADLKDMREQAQAYAPLAAYEARESILEGLISTHETLQTEISTISGIHKEFSLSLQDIQKLQPVVSLKPLSMVDCEAQFQGLIKLQGVLNEYKEASKVEEQLGKCVESLSVDLSSLRDKTNESLAEVLKVSAVKEEFDTSLRVASSFKGFSELKDLSVLVESAESSLKELVAIATVSQEYQLALKEHTKVSEAIKGLKDLVMPPNTLDEIIKISNLSTEYKEALAEVESIEESLLGCDTELAELTERLKEFNDCPFCGSTLCSH
jgi:hypothetical protein